MSAEWKSLTDCARLTTTRTRSATSVTTTTTKTVTEFQTRLTTARISRTPIRPMRTTTRWVTSAIQMLTTTEYQIRCSYTSEIQVQQVVTSHCSTSNCTHGYIKISSFWYTSYVRRSQLQRQVVCFRTTQGSNPSDGKCFALKNKKGQA